MSTTLEKTKGAVSDPAALAKKPSSWSPEEPKLATTTSDASKPTPHRGHQIVNFGFYTETIQGDPSTPTSVKLLIAAKAPFQKTGRNQPSRDRIIASIPGLNNHSYTNALDYIDGRLADVVRYPPEMHRPPEFKNLAEWADPLRAPKDQIVCIPFIALQKLSGRASSRRDSIVLGLYHSEQRRIHGIQLSDAAAAVILGWPIEQIAKSRRRLLKAGAIIERRAGRFHRPPIYEIPLAQKEARANFDPSTEHHFREEDARSLYELDLGNSTSIAVLATDRQGEEAERRFARADTRSIEQLRDLAEFPPRYIKAKDLLTDWLTKDGKVGPTRPRLTIAEVDAGIEEDLATISEEDAADLLAECV